MTYLDNALRNADETALEARQIILGMRDLHANLVVVLDALQDAIKDADWGDFAEVTESLNDAELRLQMVYATKEQA